MNTIARDFVNAITGTPAAPISCKFKNAPDPVEYTAAVLDLLKTDPAVEYIVDGITGEIIYDPALNIN